MAALQQLFIRCFLGFVDHEVVHGLQPCANHRGQERELVAAFGEHVLQTVELFGLDIEHEEVGERHADWLQDFFLQAFLDLRDQVDQQRTEADREEA